MTKPPSPLASPTPWNLVADGYADEAHGVMTPFSEAAAALVELSPDAEVVDVAAGPGTLALLVAPRVRRVAALDFSEAMLARLRASADELGLANIETYQGDGQELPFADDTFDAGFSLFGLMFFPNRPKGFSELFRVLRPGGTAVVSSWAPTDESTLMQLMFGALRAADPSRPAPQRDPTTLENPELFAEEMKAAGFRDVVIHSHVHTIAVPSAEDFWNAMVRASAPCVLMRTGLGEEGWAAVSGKAKAFIEDWLANGNTTVSTKAFLGFGRKPA